ncbi:hypothetical protein A0J61_06132 [Choanephora cucurbitarum]|uniref:Uncharacterized protein n=1 Tax=Choanephora cucurbitarum TaxID=101091 RepID=A0A1C7NB07_9FUNG|nr:hypothetical protein A0J61_06132 [Choanephora cucurbitarum]
MKFRNCIDQASARKTRFRASSNSQQLKSLGFEIQQIVFNRFQCQQGSQDVYSDSSIKTKDYTTKHNQNNARLPQNKC